MSRGGIKEQSSVFIDLSTLDYELNDAINNIIHYLQTHVPPEQLHRFIQNSQLFYGTGPLLQAIYDEYKKKHKRNIYNNGGDMEDSFFYENFKEIVRSNIPKYRPIVMKINERINNIYALSGNFYKNARVLAYGRGRRRRSMRGFKRPYPF
jgi:hypothetical protein